MEHSDSGVEVAECLDCKGVFSIETRVFYKTKIPETKKEIESCNGAIFERDGCIYRSIGIAKKDEPPISLEDYKLNKKRETIREQLRRQGILRDE
jgi:hypothetical protein